MKLSDRLRSTISELLSLGEYRPPASSRAWHWGTGDEDEIRTLVLPTPLEEVPVSRREKEAIHGAARRLFGYSTLLPAQTEVIACVLRHEDVLAILPTGAGKSLCYKLPAFMERGTTLVISPLIALMKDQVDKLPPPLRPGAIAINSHMSGKALDEAMAAIADGQYRLIFAAPERLRQTAFIHQLRRAGISRLVIDEAHCISMWGHDFRPDYLNVAQAHQALGAPPLLAMTATAPLRVRHDIEKRLFQQLILPGERSPAQRMRVILVDTYRSNLRLKVVSARDDEDKRRTLLRLCQTLQGSGIIYARTRRRCEDLAGMLRQHDIPAQHYHAGVPDRARLQDAFMRGDLRIIVATIAFGMGIDKPNIRFIIHDGLPDTIENYYQEAGRAGRDGFPADCILLYSNYDASWVQRRAERQLLDQTFLHNLLSHVHSRLAHHNPGILSFTDLQQAIHADQTSIRVGLSILEQAGLLYRAEDVPETVSIWLKQGQGDRELASFVRRAALPLRQRQTINYWQLSQRTGIDLIQLEKQLLAWQDAGHLYLSTNGRNLVLAVPAAPDDAAQTLAKILHTYQTSQKEKANEIIAYATGHHCRHGYLARQLGGITRQHCQACDYCTESQIRSSRQSKRQKQAQLVIVLQGLSEGGWGRRNLIHLLLGEGELPERALANPAWGRLEDLSGASIEALIEVSMARGLVKEQTLSHGGVALSLTDKGFQTLRRQGLGR